MNKNDESKNDIQILRKLLKIKKLDHLVDLLASSRGYLNVSSTYGSRLFSLLSTFEITSPPDDFAKLTNLNEVDKHMILECVKSMYPTRDHEPEVNWVEYFPDINLIKDEALVVPDVLRSLNFDYINEQIEKCRDKVESGDYDGAVTNARSLVESTCRFILEDSSKPDNFSGNLPKLFKEVTGVLGMDATTLGDENLKQIISGAFGIVNGIAGLRNSYSDAHGHSPTTRYKLSKRHAVLIVNLSKSISEFIYSSWDAKSS